MTPFRDYDRFCDAAAVFRDESFRIGVTRRLTLSARFFDVTGNRPEFHAARFSLNHAPPPPISIICGTAVKVSTLLTTVGP